MQFCQQTHHPRQYGKDPDRCSPSGVAWPACAQTDSPACRQFLPPDQMSRRARGIESTFLFFEGGRGRYHRAKQADGRGRWPEPLGRRPRRRQAAASPSRPLGRPQGRSLAHSRRGLLARSRGPYRRSLAGQARAGSRPACRPGLRALLLQLTDPLLELPQCPHCLRVRARDGRLSSERCCGPGDFRELVRPSTAGGGGCRGLLWLGPAKRRRTGRAAGRFRRESLVAHPVQVVEQRHAGAEVILVVFAREFHVAAGRLELQLHTLLEVVGGIHPATACSSVFDRPLLALSLSRDADLSLRSQSTQCQRTDQSSEFRRL